MSEFEFVYPPPEDWDKPPKEPLIEGYILTEGWAVFTGSEGEDPSFRAFFKDEDTARALAELRDEDGDPYFFDPYVAPAVTHKGVVYIANDYRVNTHEELIAALKEHGL